MNIDQNLAEVIFESIKSAQSILIISHRNPDADTIGSNLTLREICKKMGKDVFSACIDPLPKNCAFLPESKNFLQTFDPEEIDLFFTVDVASKKQAGFLEKYPELQQKKLINIDHHPSNERYGTINFVIDDAASATLIMYNLLQVWQQKITPTIATYLLFGLYYDTGSFMHSNTSEEVYQAAAELMNYGANKNLITENLYKNRTLEQMHVWGKVLSDIKVTNQNIAVGGITNQELSNRGATLEDVSGVIDYLSMVKGSRFATLLSEDTQGNIRGSLRTKRNDIDLSQIAGQFGGGGHKKASGFSLKGKIEKKSYWEIKSESKRTAL